MQVNEYGNSWIIYQEIYANSFTNIQYNQLVDHVKYENIFM